MEALFQQNRAPEPLTSTDSLEEAQRYCRKLARNHYENFIVSSMLVPRKLQQHLYNVYAFCRHSDDLADEIDDATKSLKLLAEWRAELQSCFGGTPRHPILVALKATVEQFDIPPEPFLDLIAAFEQDCRVTRYETFADLLEYCRRSANPVGRLVLYVFGYRDSERQELSDRICTGLQLANFWQDIPCDLARGRVYVPKEDLSAFGCSESDIEERRTSENFREMMRFEVDRTEEMFESAAALPGMLGRRFGTEIEMFRAAGMAVLSSIRKIDYDVLAHRPTLSKLEKARVLIRCLRK